MSSEYRRRVLLTYKRLLGLGRSYPKGYDHFRDQVKSVFVKSRHLTDSTLIEQQLEKADYLAREMETLVGLQAHTSATSSASNDKALDSNSG